MRDQFEIQEAQTHLSHLITRVERGEEIVIARDGRPVARLIPLPTSTQARCLGIWQGRVWIAPDFDEPISDLLDAFEGAPTST